MGRNHHAYCANVSYLLLMDVTCFICAQWQEQIDVCLGPAIATAPGPFQLLKWVFLKNTLRGKKKGDSSNTGFSYHIHANLSLLGATAWPGAPQRLATYVSLQVTFPHPYLWLCWCLRALVVWGFFDGFLIFLEC